MKHAVCSGLHDKRHSTIDHGSNNFFRDNPECGIKKKVHFNFHIEVNLCFFVIYALNIHISRDFALKKIFFRIRDFTPDRVVRPANFFADSIVFDHLLGQIIGINAFDVVRQFYLQFFCLFDKKDNIKRVVLRISYTEIPFIDVFNVGEFYVIAERVKSQYFFEIGKIGRSPVKVCRKYPLPLTYSCSMHFHIISVP